jgi:hypothetical protein
MAATTTGKKPRRRKLIVLESYTTGTGEGQTFGCKSRLPMSSATPEESLQAAARIMLSVNAQLEFVGSKYRLVMHDIELKKPVSVSFPE